MIKYLKYLLPCLVFTLISCGDDDDSGVQERDRQEVFNEDIMELNSFLANNTFTVTDGVIEFQSLTNAGAGAVALETQVESRTINRDDVDYTYYVLKLDQGNGATQATFADSTLVRYRGQLLDLETFDSSSSPVWFDLPQTVDGFALGLDGFNESTGVTQNPDGTLSFTDSGVGAVFFPSGLGFFSTAQANIPIYSPLIFSFQLHSVQITDHDGDGILSKFEDLNGDMDLRSPDFLDNTDEDLNGGFNYLDRDDDNDGFATRDENADPNGDGNPNDAQDADGDGIPDYLDDDTDS